MKTLRETIDSIGAPDRDAMAEAAKRLDTLLKPPGSLGRLEDIAVQLAGITGKVHNTIRRKEILVMCSDNGVVEEGVTSFPASISALVARTMVQGLSGVAVLAKHADAGLRITDLGLLSEEVPAGIIDRRIRRGTSSILRGPAMSREEAVRAIETGIAIAADAVRGGADLLGTGEIGIGNTTTSSAVLYALSGADLDLVVGRGAGLSDEGLARKKEVIRRAVELNRPDPADPVDVVAKVGGFDIAGLLGCYLGAAAHRVPIVIDGFIAGAAALAAVRLQPAVKDFLFTSHGSAEPGTALVSRLLGLDPILDLRMRLGEGTGCALAFHVIEAATKIINEMGTFADIGM